MQYAYKWMDSPIGKLKLVASDNGLIGILWEHEDGKRVKTGVPERDDSNPILVQTEQQLGEYFAGARKTFSVPLDFKGTDFQKKVWAALCSIPYGETRSYGQLAAQIGQKSAMRAVGAANGRNPIAIIAPCHRCIGASGKLTGFAGGLEAKAALLDIEGQYYLPEARSLFAA